MIPFRISELTRVILAMIIITLVFAALSHAQVPTDNRRTLIFDSVSQAACSGTFEVWNMHNGTCSTTGVQPWVSQVRVVSGGVITNVPRAQVQRLTVAADCSPNAVPCLRIQDVVLNGSTTVAFVTDTGVVGAASAAVPFSPAAVPPIAPTALSLRPVAP